MFVRSTLALSCALLLSGTALADASYTVFTPTQEPYQRFQNFVAPGTFQDTFNFDVAALSDSYIWLFPRQDAFFGFDKVEDTRNVTLTLVNNSTEKQWTGVLYPEAKGTVSWLAGGVLPLVFQGFDPNKSLYLDATLTPGSYSAYVSGLATGTAGSSYVIKFSVTPAAVPETGSAALMGLGLVGLAVVARRRRAAA